ncbi:unnamed protein product [Cuscuta epithymum]|uniref:Uncharacterized protein n=1 Tax=Cuscuta epithymum TaxID=186058 RepID=A0AAV0GH46_9ASTE|nr:unnamed protein product [Cuscuta epithymum]
MSYVFFSPLHHPCFSPSSSTIAKPSKKKRPPVRHHRRRRRPPVRRRRKSDGDGLLHRQELHLHLLRNFSSSSMFNSFTSMIDFRSVMAIQICGLHFAGTDSGCDSL